MNERALALATQLVFQQQLKTRDACRIIVSQTGVDAKTAEQAVHQAATWYKR